uniref:Uncharacterized protein n=1 Tax=Anguilla anguilla TaxID=7936 RepID=A0A0E9PNL6_ANGAN
MGGPRCLTSNLDCSGLLLFIQQLLLANHTPASFPVLQCVKDALWSTLCAFTHA